MFATTRLWLWKASANPSPNNGVIASLHFTFHFARQLARRRVTAPSPSPGCLRFSNLFEHSNCCCDRFSPRFQSRACSVLHPPVSVRCMLRSSQCPLPSGPSQRSGVMCVCAGHVPVNIERTQLDNEVQNNPATGTWRGEGACTTAYLLPFSPGAASWAELLLPLAGVEGAAAAALLLLDEPPPLECESSRWPPLMSSLPSLLWLLLLLPPLLLLLLLLLLLDEGASLVSFLDSLFPSLSLPRLRERDRRDRLRSRSLRSRLRLRER